MIEALMNAAQRLMEALRAENAALAQLDLTAAADLAGPKRQAADAFAARARARISAVESFPAAAGLDVSAGAVPPALPRAAARMSAVEGFLPPAAAGFAASLAGFAAGLGAADFAAFSFGSAGRGSGLGTTFRHEGSTSYQAVLLY